MSQQINIDPELWAKTRRAAFDTGVTASKLVETALRNYLLDPDPGVTAEQRSPMIDKVPPSYEVVDGKPVMVGSVLDLMDEVTDEQSFPVASDDEFERHPRTKQYAVVSGGPVPKMISSIADVPIVVSADPVRAVPKPSQRKTKQR